MIITKTVYDKIYKFIPDDPPETGGILGSRDGRRVTDVVFDEVRNPVPKHCFYEPNVLFLNKEISKWAENGISFKGIYHTHFMGVRSLSEADKKYICEIMECMPKEVDDLYFPVFVLPDRELICYRAVNNDNEISIFPDELILKN